MILLVGSILIWDTISKNRQLARAEDALRVSLDRWCCGEAFEQLDKLDASHAIEDPGLTAKMRPLRYTVTGIKLAKEDTYEATATLTFPGGDETRVYQVSLFGSGRSLVTTKSWDDISGTEAHARSILQAWLDSWVAREEQQEFRRKHPEAAGQMTMDITRAFVGSEGKRLAQYKIMNAAPTRKGYTFTVTAIIEGQGSAETKILSYDVFKDRILSEGRWNVTGR